MDLEPGEPRGDLAEGPVGHTERQKVTEDRDCTADAMWRGYHRVCHAHQDTTG
jgi:hypothetical protein